MDTNQSTSTEDIKTSLNKLSDLISSSELTYSQEKEIHSLLNQCENIINHSAELLSEIYTTSQSNLSVVDTDEKKQSEESQSTSESTLIAPETKNSTLAELVEKVKRRFYECSYFNRSLEEEAKNKDKNRCKGKMTSEALWRDEYDQHIPTIKLWETASALWRDFPEIFGQFDQEREMEEDQTQWDVEYLAKQSNYLRYDFSLERLCHLILVYDKIYGHRDDKDYSMSPEGTGKVNGLPQAHPRSNSFVSSPFVTGPKDNKHTAHPKIYQQDQSFANMRIAVYACLIISIIIFISGLFVGKKLSSSSKHQPDTVLLPKGKDLLQGHKDPIESLPDASQTGSGKQLPSFSPKNEEERMLIGDKRQQVNEAPTENAQPVNKQQPESKAPKNEEQVNTTTDNGKQLPSVDQDSKEERMPIGDKRQQVNEATAEDAQPIDKQQQESKVPQKEGQDSIEDLPEAIKKNDRKHLQLQYHKGGK